VRNVFEKAGTSCADGYHILRLWFGERFVEGSSGEEKGREEVGGEEWTKEMRVGEINRRGKYARKMMPL
jgi:hypothetical protein